MAKKDFTKQIEQKVQLGELIKKLCERKELSLRKLADMIGLQPSNVFYIQTGANAPTPEVYQKLITALTPTPKERFKLDKLYGEIRKIPPPDVCEILIKNPNLYEQIRKLWQYVGK